MVLQLLHKVLKIQNSAIHISIKKIEGTEDREREGYENKWQKKKDKKKRHRLSVEERLLRATVLQQDQNKVVLKCMYTHTVSWLYFSFKTTERE